MVIKTVFVLFWSFIILSEGRSVRIKRHPHPPGSGPLDGVLGMVGPGQFYQAGNVNSNGFLDRNTNPNLVAPHSHAKNPYLYSPVNVPRDDNVFPNDLRFYDPLLPLPNDPSFNYGVDVVPGGNYGFDGNLAFTAVNRFKTEYYPFDAGLKFKVLNNQFGTTGRSLTKSKVHDEILDSLGPLNSQVNPLNPAGYSDEIFYPYPLLQSNQLRRTAIQQQQQQTPAAQQGAGNVFFPQGGS